jgi:alkaline ceramidase
MAITNYESSPISWCEENYEMLLYICEFYNTLTGLAYVFSGILFRMNLKKVFGNRITLENYKNLNINEKYYISVYLIHILIGIFTMYFHGTLSLIGQLLDEFSIFVLILLFDIEHMKYFLTKLFICFIIFFFGKSDINRFLLFAYGFYRSRHLFCDYFNNQNDNLKKLFVRGTLSLFFGIFCWITDLLFCDHLYFHLHWAWHIFSGYALYLLSNYILFTKSKLNYKWKNFILVEPEL